jgi:hypothetical protein
MPSTRSRETPPGVTVVSKNSTTLRGLETYLRGAGVAVTSTGAIERLVEMTPPSAAAVILFPDEYGLEMVASALARLKKLRPRVLAVVVTNEPRDFQDEDHEPDPMATLLVMPKPVWAWTILDAVRARLDAMSAVLPDATRTRSRTKG